MRPVRAEIVKIVTVRALWVLWLVGALAGPLVVLAAVGVNGLGDGGTVASGTATGVVVPLLVLGIWGATLAADEYRRESIVVSAALVPRRQWFYVAKLGVASGAAAAAALVALPVSMLVILAIRPPGELRWGSVGTLLSIPLVAGVVAAVGVSIGFLARSTLVAVALVVLGLLGPQGAGSLLGVAQPWIVGATPSVVVAQVVSGGSVSSAQAFPWGGWAALGAVLLVGSAIATAAGRVYARRDL